MLVHTNACAGAAFRYIWGYSLVFGPDRGHGFIGDPETYAWFENVDAYVSAFCCSQEDHALCSAMPMPTLQHTTDDHPFTAPNFNSAHTLCTLCVPCRTAFQARRFHTCCSPRFK
jgi:hypothetical protein